MSTPTDDLALLVLEDGTVHRGRAYGARGRTLGEAVFTTGMTGYQETLTDPSYAGQIIVQTSPHIGNTGANAEDMESARVWVRGYAVRDASRIASSFRAEQSLDDLLISSDVVGISDIDTRMLKGLQRATGFDQLRDDFDTKVKSRQGVIRTQFEQVSGEIAEAEAKRSEAMNLILGFVAAAIGAPDWAQAAGWEGLWGNLGMGLIIFVLMFALVWALQAVFRKASKQGRHLRLVEE
mgnify:CR=1 FL=1